ncbi:hypothetical protein Q7C36_012219 [Tachysurus vachellii]|uniref:Uncharacterized protein n=1 Tax=Tachysurus vachellii TaxID=175792 RepID=A0AA88MKW1_TACVA|nr:hypothetical protein Q7C36_012219 [Tachysurus vachellii]
MPWGLFTCAKGFELKTVAFTTGKKKTVIVRCGTELSFSLYVPGERQHLAFRWGSDVPLDLPPDWYALFIYMGMPPVCSFNMSYVIQKLH